MGKYKRHSESVKQQTRDMADKGMPHKEIANALSVSRSTVSTWLQGASKRSRYKQDLQTPKSSVLVAEITSIKEMLLNLSAELDEHIQYLHHWDKIENALIEAGNLKLRLETTLRDKRELESKLIARAMAIHSND